MKKELENQFVFVLGRERELALSELKATLLYFGFSFDITRISGNLVFANIENFSNDDAVRLIEVLGGTIKIFKILSRVSGNFSLQIADYLLQLRPDQTKTNFAISNFNKTYNRQAINSTALSAKKSLKGRMSLRFVDSRDSACLSSILSLKNNLAGKGIEFGLFEKEVGYLIALSNPEEWADRDYNKPASDKRSGMLPPKLARIMINLALSAGASYLNLSIVDPRLRGDDKKECGDDKKAVDDAASGMTGFDTKDVFLWDPFCGSGNVLLEAMTLGIDFAGTDISEKAIRDSKENAAWLSEKINKKNYPENIFIADAQMFDLNSVKSISGDRDLIVVAEAFLGDPKKFKPSKSATLGEYLKIKKLYLNFLENLSKSKSLFKNITLCLVFPLVETIENDRFSLFSGSVDEIEKMGYTQVCKSFIYGRDYQVVKREIVLLKLEQN